MKNFNIIEEKLKEFIELVYHDQEEKRKKDFGDTNHITIFLLNPFLIL